MAACVCVCLRDRDSLPVSMLAHPIWNVVSSLFEFIPLFYITARAGVNKRVVCFCFFPFFTGLDLSVWPATTTRFFDSTGTWQTNGRGLFRTLPLEEWVIRLWGDRFFFQKERNNKVFILSRPGGCLRRLFCNVTPQVPSLSSIRRFVYVSLCPLFLSLSLSVCFLYTIWNHHCSI